MITLYQFATSPFTEKVRRALNYKRLPFNVHEVDRAAVAGGKYIHVSVSGKFPAIEHDGQAVLDSTDILEYLDRTFPERPVLPTDPRERALAHVIEDWADESLYFYEMTMRLAWPHNLEAALDEFAQSMPGIPRDQLKSRILEGVGALTRAQGVGRKPREQVVADAARHFKALDGLLEGRDWLVGDRVSSADLAVIAQANALLYAEECRTALDSTHNVRPWLARVDVIAPKTSP
ncbi:MULTISPECIES: glutathione S-transferase family protein [unclassified Bradyrhizobium]|uniref:glutathione S-transferase family protein n=1 Tax=unclassified Bradyrhizobium TaxID=2631580 RepID=UPI0015CAABEE|nr:MULTISPECIES: glutathione S-transferase family protein [unclassified Bradyrhizobium]MBB4260533.1 glutathione S-transferase [Bradyrhizobium sp. CIR3A]NYG46803.1 glutathione S-transferase [Bradyrhizobium sp. IAR9]